MVYPINYCFMFQKINNQCKNCEPLERYVGLRESVFYQPSMIDQFLCDEHENVHSADKSIALTSDIYMLFNQQRLDRQTRSALLSHFDAMAQRSDSLAALRERLTDDQLVTFIKSRYIQSPSELLSWSNYLNSMADEELKAYVDAVNAGKDTGSSGEGSTDDNNTHGKDADLQLG